MVLQSPKASGDADLHARSGPTSPHRPCRSSVRSHRWLAASEHWPQELRAPYPRTDILYPLVAPRPSLTNSIHLERVDERLRRCVVVEVIDAAHRWPNPGIRQALDVADRQNPNDPRSVIHPVIDVVGGTIMDRRPKRSERQPGLRSVRLTLTHDVSSIRTDDRNSVDETALRRESGQARDP